MRCMSTLIVCKAEDSVAVFSILSLSKAHIAKGVWEEAHCFHS